MASFSRSGFGERGKKVRPRVIARRVGGMEGAAVIVLKPDEGERRSTDFAID